MSCLFLPKAAKRLGSSVKLPQQWRSSWPAEAVCSGRASWHRASQVLLGLQIETPHVSAKGPNQQDWREEVCPRSLSESCRNGCWLRNSLAVTVSSPFLFQSIRSLRIISPRCSNRVRVCHEVWDYQAYSVSLLRK